VGIFVTLEVTIVRRIGVDDDPGCSSLLRQVNLDPTKVHSVAGNHNFARNTNAQVVQSLEIFRAPVIDVNSVGCHISGG
jgi:hypothetical protein